MAGKDNKPLSTMALKAMKPGDKPLVDVGENRGLRVMCGNGGTKTFIYRYKSPVTKGTCQVVLGHFPSKSLADARVDLQSLKSIRKEGRCPATEQREAKQQAAKETVVQNLTIKHLVDLYLEEYIEDRLVDGKLIPGARKKKGQSEVRRTLYNDAVPTMGSRLAGKVTRKDIVDMVMAIVGRGSNVQAGNVLRELTAAYEYAIGLEKFEDSFANPALLAKESLRRAKVKLSSERGKRVLSEVELTQFLQWLPDSVFTPTQKNVMRFTLWTGCRTGEVCEAKWKDVDLKKSIWQLNDTKTGIDRTVQLSTQAITFLDQLKLVTGDCLFPSQKTGRPIQQKTLTEQAWRLRSTDRMIKMAHWTPHDLRRTVRTGLSRMGCPNEVAEAILGHSRMGIEGTYDLYKFEPECREWLQKWADYLDTLMALEVTESA